MPEELTEKSIAKAFKAAFPETVDFAFVARGYTTTKGDTYFELVCEWDRYGKRWTFHAEMQTTIETGDELSAFISAVRERLDP